MSVKSQQNKKGWPASRQGQLIIEATVSTSIMIVGLLGIFVLLSRSLNMYHTAAQQYVATNLAAEGIEVTKNILDSNLIRGLAWNDGGFATTETKFYGIQYNSLALELGTPDKYLLYDSLTGLYALDTGSQTPYKRIVTIKSLSGDDEIQVNSVVTYKTNTGANFEVNLEDHFYNWRK